MLRAEKKRHRAAVLPTMAARPTAPVTPDNPEPTGSTGRNVLPGRGSNVTASPSATPDPRQAPATGKPATSGLAAIDQLLLQTVLGTPTDTRRASQWLKIAPVAACLLALASGWWLRSEVGNHVGMIAPATRAGDDLAPVQQALQQERDKAEKLARDLATAWRQLTSQAVELADNAGYKQELTDLRHALRHAEEQSAVYQKLLGLEGARTRGLEEQLRVRRDAPPGRGRNATVAVPPTSDATPPPVTYKAATPTLSTRDEPVMPTHDKPATIAPPAAPERMTITVRPAAPETPVGAETARLMARAGLLLDQGNIGAARIVFERAAEMGSALALFALAETYDPVILSTWGTLGTQGDVAKAQDLYARAYAGGVQQAKDRLNAR